MAGIPEKPKPNRMRAVDALRAAGITRIVLPSTKPNMDLPRAKRSGDEPTETHPTVQVPNILEEAQATQQDALIESGLSELGEDREKVSSMEASPRVAFVNPDSFFDVLSGKYSSHRQPSFYAESLSFHTKLDGPFTMAHFNMLVKQSPDKEDMLSARYFLTLPYRGGGGIASGPAYKLNHKLMQKISNELEPFGVKTEIGNQRYDPNVGKEAFSFDFDGLVMSATISSTNRLNLVVLRDGKSNYDLPLTWVTMPRDVEAFRSFTERLSKSLSLLIYATSRARGKDCPMEPVNLEMSMSDKSKLEQTMRLFIKNLQDNRAWSNEQDWERPSFFRGNQKDGQIAIVPYAPVPIPEQTTIEAWVAADKYNWVDPEIYKYFSLEYATENISSELLVLIKTYNRKLGPQDLDGFARGKIGELLYMGNFLNVVNLGERGEIVALGSVFKDSDGLLRVPKLSWSGGYKKIELDYLGNPDWTTDTKFLCVTNR